MKILTVSDTVVSLLQCTNLPEKFEGIELILGCGDLPFDYMEYLVSRFNRPLFYVFGNHPLRELIRADDTVKEAPEGCVNIHRRVVNYKGVLIAGFEGSMRYSMGDHQYTQAQMDWMIFTMAPLLLWNRWRYGRAVDILITHAAPEGIHDAPDLPHQGFRAFLTFMERYKPRYLIHGHTHLYRQDVPRITQFGETTVINTYGYQLLEINEAELTQRR